MNIFQKLAAKRSQLNHELELRRQLIIKSERAVTLCSKLETGIPKLVDTIRGVTTSPHFSQYQPLEDFTNRHELALEARAIKAANRLLRDLPQIKAHWEKIREEAV
jgi:hypothetical protein